MEDEYKKGSTRFEGREKERLAEEYLKKNGVRILERNFRCKSGEIDLIGSADGTIVFFEVKYRKSASSGMPYEAVNRKKQRTICRTADYYRMKERLSEDRSYRFDVISIVGDEITWYKNAFEYIYK